MSIDQLYYQSCINESDIHEHLPTLYNYAMECNSVVEFGVRDTANSTRAFVKALVDNNFPKPSAIFDIDNPEDYFNDVVDNKSESAETRMIAIGVVTMYSILRSYSKFVNLYLYSKMMKQALRRYLKLCESYE